MKILSEKKKIYYDTEMQFSDREQADLLRYAHRNMPMEVLNNFYIGWAVVDILKKQIEIDKINRKKQKKFLKDETKFCKERKKHNKKEARSCSRVP